MFSQYGDLRSTKGTKLCTMFGRLLGWYIEYTFSGPLALDGILSAAKFTLAQSCVLL